MKRVHSIRSLAILAAAIVLPLGVPALEVHHRAPQLPRFSADASPAAVPAVPDVEQNAALLVDAIIQIESNGDARMVGRHGERGLMQLKAGTWRDMTARLFGAPLSFDRAFEPALNRRVGTAYLAWLQGVILPRRAEWRSDERSLLLAAYNAGPGRLIRSNFDLDLMPGQTRDYVERAAALHDVYLDDVADADRPRLAALASASAAGI